MSAPELVQVSASAGSGKTYRLTSDFIKRLEEAGGASAPASILAVTFTNAAANEMRRRVLGRLKQKALAGGVDSGRALRLLEAFLRDPSSLNVRTIDSLLHQIVRASALELGISPDYEVGFDAKEALAPHVDLILEKARAQGPERELVRKACLASLDGAAKGFSGKSRISKPLGEALRDALQGKFDDLASIEELDKARAALEDSAALAAAGFLDACAAEGAAFSNKANAAKIKSYAERDFPDKQGEPSKKRSAAELLKGDVSVCVERAYARFKDAARSYHEGKTLLDRGRFMKPFADLAIMVAKAFREDCASQSLVLQDLAPAWAKHVLAPEKGASDALIRMGARLKHFLVDEFQDTSIEQWSVLKTLVWNALAEGGTFTGVGDVKQSIYGWRGGEPLLFAEAFRDPELSAIAGPAAREALPYNRRSAPEIVEHANAFFGVLADQPEAMAALLLKDAPEAIKNEAARRIEAAFADVRQKPVAQGARGWVCAREIEAEPEAEGETAVNTEICDLLLRDIGPRRPWSDVMILVRGNQSASALAEHLGRRGIPVITENGLLIANNPIVSQLAAMLAFLENPADDVAFWAVLSGSVFRGHGDAAELVDVNLADWAAGRGSARLDAQFREDYPEIWERVFRPFQRGSAMLTAYDAAREWISRMSVEQRFPEELTMVRRFLEVIHAFEADGASIPAFMDYWRKSAGKEKAPMPESMNAVRISTIHKAKGLEAPVVIVPSAAYQVQASSDPVVLAIGGAKAAARLVKDMGQPYYEDLMKQGLESLNLLYVALTRAKEELYILYGKGARGGSLRGVIDGMLDAAKLDLPYELGARKEAHPGFEPQFAAAAQAAPCGGAVFDGDWRPMAWLPGLKIHHAELAGRDLTPKQRGTVLHACLEFMDFDGDPREVAAAALKSGVAASVIAVPDSELGGMRESLEWFAKAAPCRDWLGRGWKEQPLMTADGRELRADLIVEERWGPLVVDYKSGEPREKHVRQIQEYMEVLAASGQFAGEPRGLIVYLDQRKFMKVPRIVRIRLEKAHAGEKAAAAKLELVDGVPQLP